ncbi:MAG: ABC transporter substrate-binding protein [Chloroflexi bacterium]|nr:ABC transporter substrate-binding protein [Chloroflexota bacterium]
MMLRKDNLTVVSLLALVGLLGSGCAPAAVSPVAPAAPTAVPKSAPTSVAAALPTPKPAAPSPTAKPGVESRPESGRYGGILTIGIGGDPPSFDVHREEVAFTFAITSGTYNNLLKLDPQGWPEFKVVPDLAAGWQLSADGKVYTFNLVKGARWHDGTPITAADVKFSFDRIRDPQLGLVKSPRRQQLGNVASIDTPDDNSVKVTLGYPQASFINLISTVYFPIMPRHVVLEKKGDMTKTVVGSGPFKFKSYASGVGWELEKNPNYFIKNRPYLDGVKGYLILDGFTRFAALRTKNILWWAPQPYMSVPQAKMIEDALSDKIALKWEFQPSWYGIFFNVTGPPWSDVRLRQAVSLSFDRKKMVAIGLEGTGVVGMSPQPPGEWALTEEEMLKVPGYAKPDLEGARKLLAEAGVPGGFKSDSLVRTTKPHQDIALLVKEAVATIGIDLDLKIVETAVYMDARFRKAFATLSSGFGQPLMDPDAQLGDFYVTGSSMNYSGYSNPHYDELYARQARTVDAAERRKIVWEMQRILLKDVPGALAYWVKVPYAWWKEVRGYTPPVGFVQAFMYEDIWLAK